MTVSNSLDNDTTILESEIIELNKFLEGLLHEIDEKTVQLQEAASSPRSHKSTSQDKCFTSYSSSSTIKYTTVDDPVDADIANVVAYEEVNDVSDNLSVVSNESISTTSYTQLSTESSELSLLKNHSPNLFSPIEPINSDLFKGDTAQSLESLDTISSIDTLPRPNINSCNTEITVPFKKYDWKPFYLFNISDLENTTYGYKTLGSRSVVYYGEYDYSYGKIKHKARKFDDNKYLLHIISYVQIVLPGFEFNSAMIHKYADGQSFIPPHSDDEDCITDGSDIVTISLGEGREMEFQNKHNKEITTVELLHGELLVMSKMSQDDFTHAIHPDPEKHAVRMSITLRHIKEPTESNTNVIHEIPLAANNSPVIPIYSTIAVAQNPSVINGNAPNFAPTISKPTHVHQPTFIQNPRPYPQVSLHHTYNKTHWGTANANTSQQNQSPRTANYREVDGYQEPSSILSLERNAPPTSKVQHRSGETLNMVNSTYSWHRQGYQPNNNPVQLPSQFPPEHLHVSRQRSKPHRTSSFRPFQAQTNSSSFRPLQSRHQQEDVVFISSSMFADLDANKLTTSDVKAHVYFYRGADSNRMRESLKREEGIQNLAKENTVKKVFLLTGTNDVDQICTKKKSITNGCFSIGETIKYVRNLFPLAIISVINILPRVLQNRQNVIHQLNEYLKQFCEEMDNTLNFIDTYATGLLTLPTGTRKCELFKFMYRNDTDNVHLNNYGIAKLGGYLKYLAHQ